MVSQKLQGASHLLGAGLLAGATGSAIAGGGMSLTGIKRPPGRDELLMGASSVIAGGFGAFIGANLHAASPSFAPGGARRSKILGAVLAASAAALITGVFSAHVPRD